MSASLDLERPGRHSSQPGKRRWLRRLLCVLVTSLSAVASTTGAALAALPTIYVEYTTDCTFTMSTDGGIAITSAAAPGVVVPPGPYQVLVSQAYALSPGAPRCPPSTLELTGPGVNLSFVVGEGSPYEEATETFPPASTFVAVVENQPLVQLVFSTAATGSSSSLLSPSPSPAPAGTGQVQPGLVGSDVAPGVATLRARLDSAGNVTLTAHGKRVVSIKAGEYELTVVDQDARAGLTVGRPHQRSLALSGSAFVGSRSEKIDLTPGSWISSSGTGARRLRVGA